MPGALYRQLRARLHKPVEGPTRREMLRLTMLGAAGLLLSDNLARAQRPPGRVLIVGAGFAGLAAAHELASIGYDVRVFEARDRVGGRVRSIKTFAPGKVVEAGAELIGSNHLAWAAYKQRFNLRYRDIIESAGDEPIVLNGKMLDADKAEAIYDEMERAYAMLDNAAALVNADEPWKSPQAAELDADNVAAWIDRQNFSADCKLALHAEFTSDNGVVTAKQSHLGNLSQIKGGGLEAYWTETEVFRCEGGNAQLADRLRATLFESRVQLKSAVTHISAGGPTASITLADGTRVDGDDVILAVPPSVWPKITIDPPLDPRLTPQMGHNVKCLLRLQSRFWRSAKLSPNSLGNGPVTATWEATNNLSGTEAVMVAFSGGPSADTVHGWAATARPKNYLDALGVAYKGIAAQFVGTPLFMDWPNEPWTMASYSFPAPGQVTSQGPILRAPLGRLHFAGEHTNYAFVGYMEGALGSGIALAKRIAQRDGLRGAA
ncbi:MAG TPA: NAD(P)/FAD-dependent oxidoreductase [Vicinamibacterales bacterium]|nr:NAD(P)/FAD-dependent oxidoreductase [Vicinamibacterales bacterium]